jgi:glycine cleavage system aminomethyltransferase T
MVPESLEAKLSRFDSPLEMMRSAPAVKYIMPLATEYTNWRDEQQAWKTTAVMFDQSHHMTDFYFEGPDVKRLFDEVGVASMATFGKNRAKQFLAVNHQGQVIADAILFGFSDTRYALVGTPVAPYWMAYQAETGGYDVEVTRDERSLVNPAGRLTFRYQLNGPLTQQILEKAHGGPLPQIKFFRMGEFELGGVPVRALNHTMAGVPGAEMTGLEIVGPAEHGPAVKELLTSAGMEFGMRQGGVLSYTSTIFESGWIPSPLPAVYLDPALKPYREWLSSYSLEGFASIGGSFVSDDLNDYHQTPWDLGYGRLVKLDHDFIGRDALAAMAEEPHRQKVWLHWNREDVARAMRTGLYGDETGARTKMIDLPVTSWIHFEFDAVMRGDRTVGVSTYAGYTVNIGDVVSLAMIDEADAVDGTEVVIRWGDADGGKTKLFVEPHVETEIRATLRTNPPV